VVEGHWVVATIWLGICLNHTREDPAEELAGRVGVLPRGWAVVKGLAAKIRELLIVRVEAEAHPKSIGRIVLATWWDYL